ncbi:SDR family NAD(P)-dependent oxidoreductase [Luminiphilus sp.]|nr:SDR family NAD(P)-dependent oxidoreductase [Luminiphilus sp.]
MGKYILSGGATGIGAAIKTRLRAQQHEVIVIDLNKGDYCVDLGDPAARRDTLSQVKADHSEFDGLITCAGVASQGKILRINYFGSIDMIEALAGNICAGGRVVAISSNSAPMSTRPDLIETLLSGDENAAVVIGDTTNGHECSGALRAPQGS